MNVSERDRETERERTFLRVSEKKTVPATQKCSLK